jgi:hypothetical protein
VKAFYTDVSSEVLYVIHSGDPITVEKLTRRRGGAEEAEEGFLCAFAPLREHFGSYIGLRVECAGSQ